MQPARQNSHRTTEIAALLVILGYLLAATIPFAMLHAGLGPIGNFTTAGVGLSLAAVYASLRNVWVAVAHAWWTGWRSSPDISRGRP